jgi:predicted flap endonuclease-1-like 5' DNA nuclease
MRFRTVIGFWLGLGLAVVVAIWLVRLWREQGLAAPKHMWGPPERGQVAPVPVPEAPVKQADDLERIRGIGPVIARRLNEAGIWNYGQLAQTPADRLEVITGNTPWDPVEWIRQAREFSRS